MESWVKIGVQRASVLYPNSCYTEPCYIEVQVYFGLQLFQYFDCRLCSLFDKCMYCNFKVISFGDVLFPENGRMVKV